MYKCKVKEDKGITLIALIVTIVALLIISGVTISSITDSENGVIENAKSAKDEAEKSEEYINIQKAVMKIKALSPTGLIDTADPKEKLEKELKKIDSNVLINKNVENDQILWEIEINTGENNKRKYIIFKNGNTSENNSITSIQVPNSTKPYLPEGFSVSLESMNDEKIKAGGALEKGLVVKDSYDNEYVWVEVPRTTAVYTNEILAYDADSLTTEQCNVIYEKLSEYANAYRQTGITDTYNSNMGVMGNITGEEDYNKLKNTMIKSIFKNGGFYIGRYEAGCEIANARTAGTQALDSDMVPLSKKNKAPISYITGIQAQDLAKNIGKNTGYTSSLLFGIQWDLVLKYMESKVDSVITTAGKNIFSEDSASWGNYINCEFSLENNSNAKAWNKDEKKYERIENKLQSNEKMLTTGATDRNKIANIYDIAGNAWEYSLEYTFLPSWPKSYRVRGGGAEKNSSARPSVYRGWSGGYNVVYSYLWGFRVAIY